MSVLFVQAGGTIDKDYLPEEDNHGRNYLIGKPSYLDILRRLKKHGMRLHWKSLEMFQKDSLDMTDKDRADLATIISRRSNTRIVVTHGTDTIKASARAIARLSDRKKTIVLTGAMKPVKFIGSDAEFNVGMALGAVQTLPPGVYIALYGRVVPWMEFIEQ